MGLLSLPIGVRTESKLKSGHLIKVGIVVFAGLIAMAGVYWFLEAIKLKNTSYPIYATFDNVMRLEKGADVRLAGVKIGKVEDIALTSASRARVNMIIWTQYKVPMDSQANITTGAMIGDAFVEVIPGQSNGMLKSGDRMLSRSAPTFDSMMSEVSVLIKKFQKTADGINAILGDQEAISQVKDIAKNLDKAIISATNLMASTQGLVDQSAPVLRNTLANVELATRNAALITKRLDGMIVKDAQPNVKAILEQAKTSAESLNKALASANGLLDGFKNSPGKIDQVLDKAVVASEQANQMLANLNKASESVKDLATDQEMNDNIRQTMRNAALVSKDAKGLVDKLNAALKLTGPKFSVDKKLIPEYGTSINALWNTRKNEARIDANYTFAFDNESFYRIGIYNIGQDSEMNLMGGRILDKRNAVRYGLIASELGVGYDYKLGGLSSLSADLYNLNDPRLEIKSVLGVGHNMGVFVGLNDALHSDRRDIMLGMRIQR